MADTEFDHDEWFTRRIDGGAEVEGKRCETTLRLAMSTCTESQVLVEGPSCDICFSPSARWSGNCKHGTLQYLPYQQTD